MDIDSGVAERRRRGCRGWQGSAEHWHRSRHHSRHHRRVDHVIREPGRLSSEQQQQQSLITSRRETHCNEPPAASETHSPPSDIRRLSDTRMDAVKRW